jgi:isocitrate/isopropylmalate dehydrogenase
VDALDRRFGLGLRLREAPIGLAALESHGSTLPTETLEAARRADGVIMAPLSTYEYPPAAEGGINPSAGIRSGLDLYANIRPARTRPGVPAPVRSMGLSMDLVVVRENTEGFYADRNMHQGSGELMPTEDLALAIRKITARGSRRIARVACELAGRRRHHVTVVHKANVLRLSDGLFLREVRAEAGDHPGLELDEMLIDAMTARIIRTPGAFDVVVTTNMYGDILSDEAAELAGGLGLAGALNAGDHHGVAQATHGSAPDIAGQGIANPTALILSAGMLLDWLGARHHREELREAWRALDEVLDRVLADPGSRTPDLGGSTGTEAFGVAVARALAAG